MDHSNATRRTKENSACILYVEFDLVLNPL